MKRYLSIAEVDRIEAAKVILDPEVYDRISDDHCPPREDFELPDIEYIGGYIDDELASILTEETFRDGYNVHFQVLKPYRWAARELFYYSVPQGILYCQVPECFMSTVNFVKHAGFSIVETEANAYLKNGKLHDRFLLRADDELCH